MPSTPSPTTLVIHLLAAAAIAFGVSLLAWFALGIFEPVSFVVVSAGATIAGAGLGLAAGARLWLTLMATAVVRVGILAWAVTAGAV